jgi:hypothetical protein
MQVKANCCFFVAMTEVVNTIDVSYKETRNTVVRINQFGGPIRLRQYTVYRHAFNIVRNEEKICEILST